MLEVIGRDRKIEREEIERMDIIEENGSLDELVRKATELGHTTGEIFQVDNAGSTGCITLKNINSDFSGVITAYITIDGKVAYRLHVRDLEIEGRKQAVDKAKGLLPEIFLRNGYVLATTPGNEDKFYVNISPKYQVVTSSRTLTERLFGAEPRTELIDEGKSVCTVYLNDTSRGANLYKKWVLEGPETSDVKKIRALIEEAVQNTGIQFSYIPSK
ncbi:TPA: hypothetical protein HA246_06240 [Candidatus Woesearchaeota archaeon]|nr:hypothetical protein [Candidatus Woesearchaeota archaeon]